MTNDNNCPDCGVAVDQPHIKECDIERCSVCGCQRITCNCECHEPMASVWTGELPASGENWLVAYYYGESNIPVQYLGTPERPFLYSENEARERAADLNAEIVNMADDEAFGGDLQIWRYAAVPMQSVGDRGNWQLEGF